MKLRISWFLISMLLLLGSCGLGTGHTTGKKENEISILRYDKLLSEYVRSNSFSAMQKLNMEYRQPTKILIENVLAIGTVRDDTISQKLKQYYSDTTLLRLIDDVEKKFPHLGDVERKLSKGFEKLRKELPDIKVPFIYTQISAFNESIVLTDTLLGISLDKYMGKDYALYKRFYYDYQCQLMSPERIVPDCLVYYLMNRYALEYHERTCLLDLMLHYGKIDYVVQKILGYKDIGESMGYTVSENRWCQAHEKAIWSDICLNQHLHATDPAILRRYMKPSPATELFGESAPILIGTWMGAQIVSSYMKRHKKTSLKELLELTDYRFMLQESGYLPDGTIDF